MFLGALICLSSLTGCGDAGQKESSEESGQPKQDSLAEERRR